MPPGATRGTGGILSERDVAFGRCRPAEKNLACLAMFQIEDNYTIP
jgi:hypothetical protein